MKITDKISDLIKRSQGSLSILITCVSVEACLPYGDICVYANDSDMRDDAGLRSINDVCLVVSGDLAGRLDCLLTLVEERLTHQGY